MNYLKSSLVLRKVLYFILIAIGSFLVAQLISLTIASILKVNITDLHNIKGPKAIYALKFIQLINSAIIFIIAPLLFAISIKYNYKKLFFIKKNNLIIIVLLITFLIVSAPTISISQILWRKLLSLDIFNGILITAAKEELLNETIIKTILTQNGFFDVILNIIIIALIPAIGEEIFFRGVIQNFISYKINPHLAIIVTSIVFSTIHMEITGILPRVLISIYLGYLFYWSASLIYPIIAHFLNNLIIIIAYYALGIFPLNKQDGVVDNPSWYLVLTSLVLVIVLIVFIKKNLTLHLSNKLIND